MRNILFIIMAVALLVCSASFAADQDEKILSVTTGTNATANVSVDSAKIRGFIESVVITAETAGSTGTASVVSIPADTSFPSVTLAGPTNVNTSASYRPRFDGTDALGAALTNDNPWRYPSVGDTTRFAITNASGTGLVFKARLKFSKN